MYHLRYVSYNMKANKKLFLPQNIDLRFFPYHTKGLQKRQDVLVWKGNEHMIHDMCMCVLFQGLKGSICDLSSFVGNAKDGEKDGKKKKEEGRLLLVVPLSSTALTHTHTGIFKKASSFP